MQQLESQTEEKEGQTPQTGDPLEAYFDRQAPRYDELLSILDFQMEDAYSYVAEFLQQALLNTRNPGCSSWVWAREPSPPICSTPSRERIYLASSFPRRCWPEPAASWRVVRA